jgi:hypothetical protein
VGTYTELTIADYPLVSSKSYVIPEVMTLFRETNRRVFTRRVAERNVLVWGEPDDPDDQETETVIDYSSTTAEAIDRLNIMGFTYSRVQDEFEAGRKAELEKYSSWAEEDDDSQWLIEEWNFIKSLTFDEYARALKEVLTDRLRPDPFDDYKKEGLNPVVKYILKDNEDYLFGFLGSDVRLLIRLACELSPKSSLVVQDISHLVYSGYYEENEPVCENATKALIAGHPENSSRIVLTEGSTDTAILKEALTILYPHLSEYYAFLDFESSRSPGGADRLVSLVKAFSATGITNRVIALFDNDTAARAAKRALANVSIPKNIAVLSYPELESLRNYPTLGPGGLTSLDVNGLAASIELYLGDDVLQDDKGQLTPVQWKGYNETLKQYQGEVMGKVMLQTRFQEKAFRCKTTPELLQTTDWTGLSAILQEIFHAFEQ